MHLQPGPWLSTSAITAICTSEICLSFVLNWCCCCLYFPSYLLSLFYSVLLSAYFSALFCVSVLAGGWWWWQTGSSRRYRRRMWGWLKRRHSRCSSLNCRCWQHSTIPEQSSGGLATQVHTAYTQKHKRKKPTDVLFLAMHPRVVTT